jgi:hypothetical protein
MNDLNRTEYCYPKKDTYFIGWDDNREIIKTYGIILTTQCLGTVWKELDLYENKQEWLDILLENGIHIDNDTDNEV